MRIPLTKGYYATVDDADAWVADFKWHALVGTSGIVYAVRTGPYPKYSKILLHRAIMGAKPGEEVDHKDRNGLDDRRRNLRVCTRAENAHNSCKRRNNTSSFKGVHWHKGKWVAQITKAGRKIYLGRHDTREDAHAAYVKAALRLHGQFARAA